MIITLKDYYDQVMQRGTTEAQSLLELELLFAGTEAKMVATEDDVVKIRDRLTCLLIAHRGLVLGNYLSERERGIPMATDGPGPVVPG